MSCRPCALRPKPLSQSQTSHAWMRQGDIRGGAVARAADLTLWFAVRPYACSCLYGILKRLGHAVFCVTVHVHRPAPSMLSCRCIMAVQHVSRNSVVCIELIDAFVGPVLRI